MDYKIITANDGREKNAQAKAGAAAAARTANEACIAAACTSLEEALCCGDDGWSMTMASVDACKEFCEIATDAGHNASYVEKTKTVRVDW